MGREVEEELLDEETRMVEEIKPLLADVVQLTACMGKLKLRGYQEAVAEAVVNSVTRGLGLSVAVMFPRQSGKNELQAQIETYLLYLLKDHYSEIVKISPTWKPQSLNAMRRLERALNRNVMTRHLWRKESGYIYRVGKACIHFLSGSPETNIVGATASALLEVDEAQDIQIAKFDREIAPMASSTNATRVFWGTAWTSQTLLAREVRTAREAERRDGIRRVFVVSADEVAKELPAYRMFVDEQVERLGRNHPLIRTQYYCEEIDGDGGLFTATRRALMQGEHMLRDAPERGKIYAALLDLAGEGEGDPTSMEGLQNTQHDLTALTIVEVDLSSMTDELLRAPTYRVVQRYQWVEVKHSELYGRLKALIEHWQARKVVADATGVGAGLVSFLGKALGERVIPFVFTSTSKSQLGWDFLNICDTGRWKEARCGQRWRHGDTEKNQEEFWRQCEMCEYVVMDGPGKLMRWGVPDGKRDPGSGEYVHDDLLISAALSAVLDRQEWFTGMPGVIIQARDVLEELDKGY